jgi:lactoylglutathione lyase
MLVSFLDRRTAGAEISLPGLTPCPRDFDPRALARGEVSVSMPMCRARTPTTGLGAFSEPEARNVAAGRRRVRRPCGSAMSSEGSERLSGMTRSTRTLTTITNIGVVMFTVADQDSALAFYTEKLGFEVRGDSRFGENGEYRWLEVAPPGSRARLALNPPMGGQPGGGGIGVETPDVLAEHRRLSALGVDVDPEPMRTPGAPLLFMMRDPDGNHIAVAEAPPAE